MGSWSNFYLLLGGASATLTGLMFVAITFGAHLVKEDALATARAFVDPIFAHFVQVLVVSGLMVAPDIAPSLLGGLIIAMAVFRTGMLVSVFGHVRRAHAQSRDIELSDWLINVVVPAALYILMVASGAGIIVGHRLALPLLAGCSLVQVALAILGAWELLLWMATKTR